MNGFGLSEILVIEDMRVELGEVKVIENANVHIAATIICKGRLKFHNCYLRYNESEASGKILVSRDGSLHFENYIVECWGHSSRAFIRGAARSVIFRKCYLEDCGAFLKLSRVVEKLGFQSCHMSGCSLDFSETKLGENAVCEISECIVDGKRIQ